MPASDEQKKSNERSGFMTFIFIWYLIGAVSQGTGLLNSLFMLIMFFIASPALGLGLLGMLLLSAIVLTLLIIYLIKVFGMKEDLKRWTDIYHLTTTITGILSLAGIMLAPYVLFPHEMAGWNLTNYHLIMSIVFGLGLMITIGFWIGIRTHLARLEREGKATFSPGLFNKGKKA
jgi:hypothetical protein